MIVTDIVELTKSRSRIYLDGEFAFVLYKGELRLYHIVKGEELTESDYEEILNTVLKKRAKKRCLMLLQKKDYTEEELRRKLRDGEYPADCIEEAIEYVKSYRYVDDYRYCMSYISCYGDTCSRQQILSRLLAKGVDKKCILQAYEEAMDKGDVLSEEELIYAVLTKKHFDISTADSKARQKMYRHLLYKGFSAEGVSRILNTSFRLNAKINSSAK